jgi:hypothetical protein
LKLRNNKGGFIFRLRPKRYLQEFINGDLKINASDCRDIYFHFAEYVPGAYGLQDFESAIIVKHNAEVDAYLKQQNVVIPYRNSLIGLTR